MNGIATRIGFHYGCHFGDVIHSSRFLPYAWRGRTYVVHRSLVRLFHRLGPHVEPATAADQGIGNAGIPAPDVTPLPQLWADPSMHLPPSAGPRVGLCWRGSGSGAMGLLADGSDVRDVPAHLLLPLLDPRIEWQGLVHGPQAAELPIPGIEAVRDWADTAAVVLSCDLVVSSCTAIAHLAASLGVPTWVLSPAPCRDRWANHTRGPIPDYPTVRVLQQVTMGEWDDVIAELAGALLTHLPVSA